MLQISAVGFLGLLTAGACSMTTKATETRAMDDRVIEKAIQTYTKGKISRELLLKTVDPQIVYLPDMTCVGLNLRRGVAGGDTTICFNKKGQEVLNYVSGQ